MTNRSTQPICRLNMCWMLHVTKDMTVSRLTCHSFATCRSKLYVLTDSSETLFNHFPFTWWNTCILQQKQHLNTVIICSVAFCCLTFLSVQPFECVEQFNAVIWSSCIIEKLYTKCEMDSYSNYTLSWSINEASKGMHNDVEWTERKGCYYVCRSSKSHSNEFVWLLKIPWHLIRGEHVEHGLEVL